MSTPQTLRAPWIATRDEALRRLTAFVPRAGRDYAAQRNYDRGPCARDNVSTLSPYIRHRAIAETEVLQAVLARHTSSEAFKFTAEIFWRTYWKGWLEAHPAAWSRYRDTLDGALGRLEREPELARNHADAVAGRTGIDAFDAWASELVATGYLHNHARMWFASVWIFTLRLPWELGANFFMRHLLDGDQASNTLSWRWVAGLHTRGKTYRATRDNIRRYTENRYEPGSALATSAAALRDPAVPARLSHEEWPEPAANRPSLLVLHDDDLGVASLDVPNMCVQAVCTLLATDRRSPQGVAGRVRAFTHDLASDARALAAGRFEALDCGSIDGAQILPTIERIVRIARENGVTAIVTPFAPVGPMRDVLDGLASGLPGTLTYAEIRRRYDALAWPHATRGFYGLATQIPQILQQLDLVLA